MMNKEVEIIVKYLTGKQAEEKVILEYTLGITNKKLMFNEAEEKVWKIVLKYPIILGIIDGGLFYVDKFSVIRKRIYLMLAILETRPLYYDCFFSKNQKVLLSVLAVVYYGVKGMLTVIFGIILLKLLSYKRINLKV